MFTKWIDIGCTSTGSDIDNIEDIEIVKELVQNHVIHTKSPKGNDILKNWKKLSKNFIKVMPTDYKRALEMMAKKEIEKSF